MIVKIGIVAGDCTIIYKVFCLKEFAIRGEDELGLLRSGFGTFAQRVQRGCDGSVRADLDMDVVALENATQVGLIGIAALQPLDRGGLVAERFEKGVRKAIRIERLLRELRDSFFNFTPERNRSAGARELPGDSADGRPTRP